MRVRTIYSACLVSALLLALLLVACGGEEPQVVDESVAAGKRFGAIFKEMRRDPLLGEGGWFRYKVGSEDFNTEYGYSDFRPSAGEGKSRLFLLSKPIGKGEFPLLQIVVFGNFSTIDDYAGKTLGNQTIKFKLEKKKDSKTVIGEGNITIDKVTSEWVEGTFDGLLGQERPRRKISGSFKTRINIPEELAGGGEAD